MGHAGWPRTLWLASILAAAFICNTFAEANPASQHQVTSDISAVRAPVQSHGCRTTQLVSPATYRSGVRGRCGPPTARVCHGTVGPPEENEGPFVVAFAEDGKYIACAYCRRPDSAFALPLPPGRYRLEFQSSEGNGPFTRESRLVEVKTARWSEIYALGAKPGPIPFVPCPILP
jgi:hypothetical protein